MNLFIAIVVDDEIGSEMRVAIGHVSNFQSIFFFLFFFFFFFFFFDFSKELPFAINQILIVSLNIL